MEISSIDNGVGLSDLYREALRAKKEADDKLALFRLRALPQIVAMMKSSGISISDIRDFIGDGEDLSVPKYKKPPAPPKYRNPTTGETHSGRGQLPTWLRAARETKTLPAFLI